MSTVDFHVNLVALATSTTEVTAEADAFVDSSFVKIANHNATLETTVSPDVFSKVIKFQLPSGVANINELLATLSVQGAPPAPNLKFAVNDGSFNPGSGFTQFTNVDVCGNAPTSFAVNLRDDIVAAPFEVILNSGGDANPISNNDDLKNATRELADQFATSFIQLLNAAPVLPFDAANISTPTGNVGNFFRQLVLGFDASFAVQEQHARDIFERMINNGESNYHAGSDASGQFFKFPFKSGDSLTAYLELSLDQPLGSISAANVRSLFSNRIAASATANEIQTWTAPASGLPKRLYKIKFNLEDRPIPYTPSQDYSGNLYQAEQDANVDASGVPQNGFWFLDPSYVAIANASSAAYPSSSIDIEDLWALSEPEYVITTWSYDGEDAALSFNEYDSGNTGTGRESMRLAINESKVADYVLANPGTTHAAAVTALFGSSSLADAKLMTPEYVALSKAGSTDTKIITSEYDPSLCVQGISHKDFIAAKHGNDTFILAQRSSSDPTQIAVFGDGPSLNEVEFLDAMRTGVSGRQAVNMFTAPGLDKPYYLPPLIIPRPFAKLDKEFCLSVKWVHENSTKLVNHFHLHGVLDLTNGWAGAFFIPALNGMGGGTPAKASENMKFFLNNSCFFDMWLGDSYQFTKYTTPLLQPRPHTVAFNAMMGRMVKTNTPGGVPSVVAEGDSKALIAQWVRTHTIALATAPQKAAINQAFSDASGAYPDLSGVTFGTATPAQWTTLGPLLPAGYEQTVAIMSAAEHPPPLWYCAIMNTQVDDLFKGGISAAPASTVVPATTVDLCDIVLNGYAGAAATPNGGISEGATPEFPAIDAIPADAVTLRAAFGDGRPNEAMRGPFYAYRFMC